MLSQTRVLVLAAGLGKRMKCDLPKGLHSVAGKPLLFHILDETFAAIPSARIGVVVGHGREKVEAAIRAEAKYRDRSIEFILQTEQRGTGHAVRCAMESEWGRSIGQSREGVLVLPGDLPLVTRHLVADMVEPLSRQHAMRLLTCELTDPTGYGRIVRKGKQGAVLRIVEEKDASLREKAIREVGASIYFFQAAFLKSGVSRLTTKNSQGEYYLTDLVAQASGGKKGIDVLKWARPEDVRGVNDRYELAQAASLLNARIIEKWARGGVSFRDLSATWIDADVEISECVTIGPGVSILGNSRIDKDAVIGPHAVISNSEIGTGAEIKAGSVIEASVVRPNAKVGPYAHLRPESDVGENAKIGNFVELKKTKIGKDTSVAHLSYLGDAVVGERANIGCGFVTCNFDGRVIEGSRKHRTIIEDDVFMGSDCQTVAPVRVGKGAFVASGSTVTEDVPSEALAIARSRQVNKAGYARKLKGNG